MNSPNKLEVCLVVCFLTNRLVYNYLQVSIDHKADWWLGNLDDPWFKALEGAIKDEWGVQPLRIREGGVNIFVWLSSDPYWRPIALKSIPSVPFLEKEFGCHALHLPLGQSTVSCPHIGWFRHVNSYWWVFLGPSPSSQWADLALKPATRQGSHWTLFTGRGGNRSGKSVRISSHMCCLLCCINWKFVLM